MAASPSKVKTAKDLITRINNIPRRSIIDPDTGLRRYEGEIITTGVNPLEQGFIEAPEQYQFNRINDLLSDALGENENIDFVLRQRVGSPDFQFLRRVAVDRGNRV